MNLLPSLILTTITHTPSQTKQKLDPLHLFITGGAGIGKSCDKRYHQIIQLTLRTEGGESNLPMVLFLALDKVGLGRVGWCWVE